MDRNPLHVHRGVYSSVYKTPPVVAGEFEYSSEAVKTSIEGSTPNARVHFHKMLLSLRDLRAMNLKHENIHWFYVRDENVIETSTGKPSLTLNRAWFNCDILQYTQRKSTSMEVLQAAQALKYLHRHGLVHGHIHPSNIFTIELTKEANNHAARIVVTDVGVYTQARRFLLHHDVLPSDPGKPPNVSLFYQAPEWLHPGTDAFTPPEEPSDIYALAGTTFAVATGQPPVYGDLNAATMATSHLNIIRPPENIMDSHLWDLIQECWQVDPIARPTIQDVVSRLDDISTYI